MVVWLQLGCCFVCCLPGCGSTQHGMWSCLGLSAAGCAVLVHRVSVVACAAVLLLLSARVATLLAVSAAYACMHSSGLAGTC
jgi:hypothetical protein